jgi:hypothetical protein
MKSRGGLARLDRYTVQARLVPALIVALPIALAAVVVVGTVVWATVAGVVAWAGGTAVLAQLGRDGGKRKEPALFASWGGKPTVVRLRHRGPTNPVTLARWHAKLKKAMGKALPTPKQETADPDDADIMYEACGTLLRGATRDQKKFPLIFSENCSYGMRRNLWGMKPLGIGIAVIGLLVVVVVALLDLGRRETALVAGGLDVVLLVGWIFAFTPSWVRVPAEAYAERLLEASEKL